MKVHIIQKRSSDHILVYLCVGDLDEVHQEDGIKKKIVAWVKFGRKQPIPRRSKK